MTELKERAVRMIEELDDEKVAFVIRYIGEIGDGDDFQVKVDKSCIKPPKRDTNRFLESGGKFNLDGDY